MYYIINVRQIYVGLCRHFFAQSVEQLRTVSLQQIIILASLYSYTFNIADENAFQQSLEIRVWTIGVCCVNA